jgi:hypothetical protein
LVQWQRKLFFKGLVYIVAAILMRKTSVVEPEGKGRRGRMEQLDPAGRSRKLFSSQEFSAGYRKRKTCQKNSFLQCRRSLVSCFLLRMRKRGRG